MLWMKTIAEVNKCKKVNKKHIVHDFFLLLFNG